MLRNAGFDVCRASTAFDDARITPIGPAVALIDVDGAATDPALACRTLRTLDATIRIVVIADKRSRHDAIAAFHAGADDYLCKPISVTELFARLRSHLRRPLEGSVAHVLRVGDLSIDLRTRAARCGETKLSLTPKALDLLAFLAIHQGTAVRREDIMGRVWRCDSYRSSKTLDVHIAQIRQRLTGSDVRVTTLRRIGYRLDVTHEAASQARTQSKAATSGDE